MSWAGTGGKQGRNIEDAYVPGQFLWEVDPGLPAERAGMQAGDRLVAVAGESVEGLSHEETVSRIRAQGSCISLTVVDPKADRFFSMVRAEGQGLGWGQKWSRAQVEGEATGLFSLPPSRFACPRSSSWRAQRFLALPRTPAQPLWLRPRTHQLKM